MPLLRGEEVPDWRTLALIEHHGPLAQADEQEDPDLPGARSGNPPTYAAIRSPSSVYVEYGDGIREYHDHVTDPYELQNTFVSLAPDKKASLHAALVALQACHGTENCWQSARAWEPESRTNVEKSDGRKPDAGKGTNASTSYRMAGSSTK